MLEFPKKSKIEGFPVNDVETGVPLAFMAAKLLAKKDSKVLTMLGAGPIAKACFRAIMTNLKHIDAVKKSLSQLKVCRSKMLPGDMKYI